MHLARITSLPQMRKIYWVASRRSRAGRAPALFSIQLPVPCSPDWPRWPLLGPQFSIWLALRGADIVSTRASNPEGLDYSRLLVRGDHHDNSGETRESKELRLRLGQHQTIETYSKIAKTFRFDDVVEAYRYMESNEQIGKIVLTVGE